MRVGRCVWMVVLGGSVAVGQITPNSPVVPAPKPDRGWIVRSDGYTQLLLDVQLRHSPEQASQEGLSQYDKEISILTREDEDLARKETEAALGKIKTAAAGEKDPRVEQDLQILIHATEPPPFLNNTGQRGVFILPLNLPSAGGGKAGVFDDFTFDAASWTLTAHEARPGHELQFDRMVEQGVSKARALYAFNSTNVEGWGLY